MQELRAEKREGRDRQKRRDNGRVVVYLNDLGDTSSQANDLSAQAGTIRHELATIQYLARQLAALKGFDYADEYSPDAEYGAKPLYIVPRETLLHRDCCELGIVSEHDFFGGSVAYPFVATKTITHPLIDGGFAPAGWDSTFAREVHDVVLPGYSAFSRDDARRAGMEMISAGSIRLKEALACGGQGQWKIDRMEQLDEALSSITDASFAQGGVVIESNLLDPVTYSVGQVVVDELTLAYYGTQQLTTNHQGNEVYGGSTLQVVRGGLSELQRLSMPPETARAVKQAIQYDCATASLPGGLLASRRNYDVILGVDEAGNDRSGVLEQSWRLGGASAAEIAALGAFRNDPSLKAVTSSTVEIYDIKKPPRDACVYFSAIDSRVGALTKYCTLSGFIY